MKGHPMRQDSVQVKIDWSPLRSVPSGVEGHPRGNCESCGLYVWSDGAYRLPRLPGWYCTVKCVELALAQRSSCHWCFHFVGEPAGTKRRYCDENCRRQAQAFPLGDGTRLLGLLVREYPGLHAEVLQGAQRIDRLSFSSTCKECGVSLDGMRAGSEFCSDAHSKRFRRRQKSSTSQNSQIIPDMPIQNKALREEQIAA
jgi:hypothetical protein